MPSHEQGTTGHRVTRGEPRKDNAESAIIRPKRLPNRVKAISKMTIATAALQPVWHSLYRLSLYGMGFRNALTRYNGEERVVRTVLSQMRARTIVDVGANRGEFASLFAEAAPSAMIHCFEPSRYFDQLSDTCKGSGFRLNRCALSDRNGTVEFLEPLNSKSYYGSTALERRRQKSAEIEQWNESTVPARTLDSYADEHGIAEIDYLKVDVDGGERAVLEGARGLIAQRQIRFIHMELSEGNLLSGLTLLLLSEMTPGYEIFRMLPRGLMPLIDRRHCYDPSKEIFHWCNLLLVRSDERHLVTSLLPTRERGSQR
jgi:FkbM family methyltransferase